MCERLATFKEAERASTETNWHDSCHDGLFFFVMPCINSRSHPTQGHAITWHLARMGRCDPIPLCAPLFVTCSP